MTQRDAMRQAAEVGILTPPIRIVVIGTDPISRETIAKGISDQFSAPYFDGDSLHPRVGWLNLQDASENDKSRPAWLGHIGEELRIAGIEGLVVSASALRRRDRDVIRWNAPNALFVAIAEPGGLGLEPIGEDERGLTIRPDHGGWVQDLLELLTDEMDQMTTA